MRLKKLIVQLRIFLKDLKNEEKTVLERKYYISKIIYST